ncbi:MAG: efflux RND transporter periplasmic adaptor subunit [Anaerolineales bacterium]|nr:MAG: efflux RND transporter periplasmic adaptor subunit [Anaerolineales bacterium]
MRRWRTWAIVAFIVIAAAGVLVLRMRSGTSQASSFTQVVAVERGNLVAAITPTGEVSTQRRAELSFDVSRIPLLELNVTPGQQVRQGEVLARIDASSLQRAVDQAEADLLSAEESLQEARDPYSELDRQKAQLDVAQAEVALEEAKLALQEFTDADLVAKALRRAESTAETAHLNLVITQHSSTVGKNVRDLEYTVAWQERQLRSLQDQLQHGKVEQSAVDEQAEVLAEARAQLTAASASAQTNLAAAEDRVTEAEEALAELQGGSSALTLAQARNKVSQAEYNLAKAKETLATVLAGSDAKVLQLAQARYDAAKATLEEAQASLDAATMVAPFDATVISVGAEVGDLVSSNINVVTLADLTDLEVLAIVDETDISQVEVGQEAQITFDAFPGRRFRGQVLEVPLEGTLVQNVVTYEVPVTLEGADGVAIKPGMTANLSIVVGRRENVLLLPALAVLQAEDGSVVMVQDTSQPEGVASPVEVGLSDGTYVEVLRGLNEGDLVLVEYQSSEQQTGGFPGFGALIRGGQQRIMRP